MSKTFSRQLLADALEELGAEPEETIRADYSGRGMYGATCFGIILSNREMATFGVLLARQLLNRALGHDDANAMYDEVNDGLRHLEGLLSAGVTDSMGRDTILYFPGWTLED